MNSTAITNYLKKEASKFSLRQHAVLALISAYFALFGFYGFAELKKAANITNKEFSEIIPERVTLGKVLTTDSESPVLYFETSSGKKFERGFYTPNFMELKKAIHNNYKISIWYGNELNLPFNLKALMPKSAPPIYQIMANGEIILPFESMREHHIGQASVISYILLALGIACSAIVCFTMLGIRLWLQTFKNMNRPV